MNTTKIVGRGLLHALGTLIYVAAVALLMMNGEAIFGRMATLIAPVAFLLLFVSSAAIVGLLVFGRPVYLYFEGAKKEAVLLAISTVAWLVIITVAILLVQILLAWR